MPFSLPPFSPSSLLTTHSRHTLCLILPRGPTFSLLFQNPLLRLYLSTSSILSLSTFISHVSFCFKVRLSSCDRLKPSSTSLSPFSSFFSYAPFPPLCSALHYTDRYRSIFIHQHSLFSHAKSTSTSSSTLTEHPTFHPRALTSQHHILLHQTDLLSIQ